MAHRAASCRCSATEVDPLAAAIEPLGPGLRRYARSWLRDQAMADDLVQDCLERAVGRWRQRRGTEVRPWVYAILHNLLVDHKRQHVRRGTAVPLHLVDDVALGRPADQDAGLHHRDLLRALDALPEEQRTVLLLISVEGLSYGEVAAVVGVPLGTVMSRISRGRDRLATLLREGERPRLRSVQ